MPAPDAVLVPGGGLLENGELPPWVVLRLDRALERAQGAPIITLSAYTTHKPLRIDAAGKPSYEATAGARYLLQRGYPADKILTETASWDTIGNAYFSRVIHTDPAGYRNLLVVNSDFHMQRTRAIFRWVYALDPPASPYIVTFDNVPDVGLSPRALAGRATREQASLEKVAKTSAAIDTLAALHHWLFTAHHAYATGLEAVPTSDAGVLQSY